MDLVGTTSSIQSSVSVTCTLGTMFILVAVGTIVPVLRVMTTGTGSIVNCQLYRVQE